MLRLPAQILKRQVQPSPGAGLDCSELTAAPRESEWSYLHLRPSPAFPTLPCLPLSPSPEGVSSANHLPRSSCRRLHFSRTWPKTDGEGLPEILWFNPKFLIKKALGGFCLGIRGLGVLGSGTWREQRFFSGWCKCSKIDCGAGCILAVNILKTVEWYSLHGWIVWNVNYISIFKKQF